jgi:predicted DNA-binding WGR domain protein
MSKIAKSSYPQGHSEYDFECFGPPATKDGEFDGCKIADLGSFSQEEKNDKKFDSNKYYHACICKSKLNNNYYTYFEWGRVGASNPQFQFEEFSSESAASAAFVRQCHEKNDKRGVWGEVAGKRTLLPKPGKDVYLVRNLATRSTGLPSATTIKLVESDQIQIKKPVVSKSSKKSLNVDPYTSKLLDDLLGATINYTKSSMADNSIPSLSAINDARDIILYAQKRLLKVGNVLDDQINDQELRNCSSELYKRIPKKKQVGTPDSVWILSQDNILAWNADLDAFESALSSDQALNDKDDSKDPFRGLPLVMEWLDPKSDIGSFIHSWWPQATANKHYSIGNLKVKNAWKVQRHGDQAVLANAQKNIIQENKKQIAHTALFQPKDRIDLSSEDKVAYKSSNTCLLHHGTRSCNVSGILRENFRFPKELVGVVITGAMFGSGSYFADDIKKSVGYTSYSGSYWSKGGGGISNRGAFMFACDVVLGQPHLADGPYGYKSAPQNTHCIFGKGKNALSYTGGTKYSGVENNEWVIFKKDQVQIKYLIEFAA